MDAEASKQLDELARPALAALKNYFSSNDENAGRKADNALKLLGRINGNDSNKLKAMSLQFQVARSAGLKGPSLSPLLHELNPALDAKAAELPAPEGQG